MRLWVPPSQIRPFHPVKNQGRLRDLAAKMREEGWIDRPVLAELIVEDRPPNARAPRARFRFQAWTAAHRIVAARLARLSAIPVHLVADKCLSGSIIPASGRAVVRKRGAYLFSLPIGWYDDDRMRFLLALGDASSAAILRAEFDANLAEDRQHAWKAGRSWAASQLDAK